MIYENTYDLFKQLLLVEEEKVDAKKHKHAAKGATALGKKVGGQFTKKPQSATEQLVNKINDWLATKPTFIPANESVLALNAYLGPGGFENTVKGGPISCIQKAELLLKKSQVVGQAYNTAAIISLRRMFPSSSDQFIMAGSFKINMPVLPNGTTGTKSKNVPVPTPDPPPTKPISLYKAVAPQDEKAAREEATKFAWLTANAAEYNSSITSSDAKNKLIAQLNNDFLGVCKQAYPSGADKLQAVANVAAKSLNKYGVMKGEVDAYVDDYNDALSAADRTQHKVFLIAVKNAMGNMPDNRTVVSPALVDAWRSKYGNRAVDRVCRDMGVSINMVAPGNDAALFPRINKFRLENLETAMQTLSADIKKKEEKALVKLKKEWASRPADQSPEQWWRSVDRKFDASGNYVLQLFDVSDIYSTYILKNTPPPASEEDILPALRRAESLQRKIYDVQNTLRYKFSYSLSNSVVGDWVQSNTPIPDDPVKYVEDKLTAWDKPEIVPLEGKPVEEQMTIMSQFWEKGLAFSPKVAKDGEDTAVAAKIDVNEKILARCKAAGSDITATQVRRFIDAWAASSGEDEESALLQLRAQTLFNLTDAKVDHQINSGYWKTAQEYIDNDPKMTGWADAFLKAEYENTQEWFKARGVKYLYLIRGASYKTGEENTLKDPKQETFALQPLSSFSTDIGTACGFAGTRLEAPYSAVHVCKVPVEDIIGSCRTGCGCLNEKEVVVLGKKHKGYTFYIKDEKGYSRVQYGNVKDWLDTVTPEKFQETTMSEKFLDDPYNADWPKRGSSDRLADLIAARPGKPPKLPEAPKPEDDLSKKKSDIRSESQDVRSLFFGYLQEVDAPNHPHAPQGWRGTDGKLVGGQYSQGAPAPIQYDPSVPLTPLQGNKAVYVPQPGIGNKVQQKSYLRAATQLADPVYLNDPLEPTKGLTVEDMRTRCRTFVTEALQAMGKKAWDEASHWYYDRFKEQAALSAGTGVPQHVIAGIVSALSPGKDWARNWKQAQQVISYLKADNPITLSRADVLKLTNERLKYGTHEVPLPGIDALVAKLGSEQSVTVKPSELDARLIKSVWTKESIPQPIPAFLSRDALGKAISIFRSNGASIPDILDQPKTTSFFDNMLHPDKSIMTTIDIHMMRCLSGKPHLSTQVTPMLIGRLSQGGRYGVLAGIVEDVAKEMNMQPHVLQAGLWEYVRNYKWGKADKAKRFFGAQSARYKAAGGT